MRMPSIVRAVAAAVIACLALAVAACGSSTPTGNSSAGVANPVVTATIGTCHIGVSTNLRVKPLVTFPTCATPPDKLQALAVVTGTGQAVTQGESVTLQYVGYAVSTRKQFASSWDDSKPLVVTGVGQDMSVALGFNFGLVGTRAGGRYLLVFPPDMAFGPSGGQGVGANDTIVYVVDITKVAAAS